MCRSKPGMLPLIALTALTIALPVRADPPAAKPGPRADVLAFLKDHAIGKSLTTGPTTGKLEEKLEYEFSRRTTFCDLTETDKGLTFDVVNVVTQTNYDLDDKGKRIPPGRVENRVVTARYELRQLESAPLLVGGARITANSAVDPTGSVGLIQMEMRDGKLMVRESTQMTDYFAPGGKFRLVADENEVEFAVVGGKLQRTQTITSYDVDPATLKRTPHGEPSKLVDKEEEGGAK